MWTWSNEPAIRAQGLGKRYRRRLDDKGALLARFRRRSEGDSFWALRNVSLEVPRGMLVGIIGANGAGKTTLLKILSRITRPNEGRAEIYGRIGSLLAVGTGFHPELTGSENIYLNGALIGMDKAEIRRKFDDIVAFSGVNDWIDIPIKRYSSGMKVRLAFAIAAQLEQEIMLLDEVLAVGDAWFRRQCFKKIGEVTEQGRTVLLVSHELPSIASKCERAIWLDSGSVRDDGPASEVVGRYLTSITGAPNSHRGLISLAGRSEGAADNTLHLNYVKLLNEEDQVVPCFATGETGKLAVGYQRSAFKSLPSGFAVSLTILNVRQQPVALCENVWADSNGTALPEAGELICELEKLPLLPGRYTLAVVSKVGGRITRYIVNAGDFDVVAGCSERPLPPPGSADVLLAHRWSVRRQPADQLPAR